MTDTEAAARIAQTVRDFVHYFETVDHPKLEEWILDTMQQVEPQRRIALVESIAAALRAYDPGAGRIEGAAIEAAEDFGPEDAAEFVKNSFAV